MLGLTGLITPILLGASVLLGIAVADVQAIYIRDLAVPPSMTQAGFTAAVVEHRINDNILALERQARTRPESRRLAIEADKTPLELVSEYFHLDLLVRAVQESTRLTEYAITGSIVVEGENHVMRMSIRRYAGQRTAVRIVRPVAEVDQLLLDAADGILRVTDPHIMCTYHLRQGLLAAPRDIDTAHGCITQTLPLASPQDRLWLYNLLGVVAYLREDHAGALSAFQSALRIDREFSPAMLNLGILLAQNGRHADAIRAFRAVFDRESIGESPQTYAAAYTEWGNSLMPLGREEEARTRYAAAIRVDHRYAPAYFAWSDSLPPGREQDALRRFGRVVAELHDQLYTENLLGAIRIGQMVARRD
jgi:tetratricopeptide (TPR) repeat protein